MAIGTVVRVLLAILCAGTCSIGLWRTCRPGVLLKGSPVTALKFICLAGCAWYTIAWLVIAALRYSYPFELEWIGGELHDHCIRVLSNQPLYVPPSSSWFPYEYQPIYFWVCAILMKITHNESYEPMRLVSILSTIGSAAVLYIWTRSLIMRAPSAKNTPEASVNAWPAIAVGILFAGYRFTGAWYDAEHLDMLFTLLLLVGGYLLQCAEDARIPRTSPTKPRFWQLTAFEYTLLSGTAFVLAFFTKQQGAFFILACLAALALRRSKANLITFAAITCGMTATGIYVLNHATYGWYSYYCYKVPLSNGINLNVLGQFFQEDMPLYAPVIAIIALALYCTRKVESESASGDAPAGNSIVLTSDGVFIGMVVAAIASGLLSRAHWGGAENVLIATYMLTGAAACVAAGRWEIQDKRAAPWLYALCASQLVIVCYRPDLQVPHKSNYAAGEAYRSLITSLQRGGDVLCIDHGGFTATPHFQTMALLDVIGKEKQMPKTIQAALSLHRYAAIVTDAAPSNTGIFAALPAAYPNVTRVGITGSWVVTGFPTPSPTRPVYILRPPEGIKPPAEGFSGSPSGSQ